MDEAPKTYLDKQILPNAEFVLISYAHASKATVYADLNELFVKGLNYWYDKELLSGEDWSETVKRQLQDPRCCGIIFFFDLNCLINKQDPAKEGVLTGRDAVEREIKIFEEISKTKPDMRAFCVLNAEDQSVYSIVRKAFILCADLSDSQLKEVLPESRVMAILKAFNKDKIYIQRNGDYIDRIVQTVSKTNALAVTDCKSALQRFQDAFPGKTRETDGNTELVLGSYQQTQMQNSVDCPDNIIQTRNGIKCISKNRKQYAFEPLEWILLETDGETATLLSKKILDFKNGSFKALDNWLKDFLLNAFSEEEKAIVLNVDLPDVKTVEMFGGKLKDLCRTEYAETCFGCGQSYVWLKDCKDNCRYMLCSVTDRVPDTDYDYIDSYNGIMPTIKIKI